MFYNYKSVLISQDVGLTKRVRKKIQKPINGECRRAGPVVSLTDGQRVAAAERVALRAEREGSDSILTRTLALLRACTLAYARLHFIVYPVHVRLKILLSSRSFFVNCQLAFDQINSWWFALRSYIHLYRTAAYHMLMSNLK